MNGSYLGPSFSQAEMERRLEQAGAKFSVLGEAEMIDACADILASGNALGWFQGRMEFGPRSLGARSILADARSPQMRSILNLKVKFRESFRPFAPSVLREDLSEWFDLDRDSPYMLLVCDVAQRHRKVVPEAQRNLFGIDRLNVPKSDIPAVTHVDDSARVQTVDRERNPRLTELLEAFAGITGCPVMINTSFNIRGEPIVCTAADAYRCFMTTNIDVLVIDDFLLLKDEQPGTSRHDLETYLGQYGND